MIQYSKLCRFSAPVIPRNSCDFSQIPYYMPPLFLLGQVVATNTVARLGGPSVPHSVVRIIPWNHPDIIPRVQYSLEETEQILPHPVFLPLVRARLAPLLPRWP